ncbi:dephospho-CoA kinase [Planctomycetales bacterium]|nr:dephospho-CoA kinase [Planctomycetales bacterium]
MTTSIVLLGLIGGIGSGKTTVAEMFHRRNVPVINADRIGYQVLQLPQVIEAAQLRWSGAILTSDGQIDRKHVADIVFNDAQERTFWNDLTHPLIADEVNRQIRQYELDGVKRCLLDAPLLLESGWNTITDKIIFIDVPFELRLQRVQERGWTESELKRREAAQWSVERKKQFADVVIDNSGTLDATQTHVDRVLGRKLAV